MNATMALTHSTESMEDLIKQGYVWAAWCSNCKHYGLHRLLSDENRLECAACHVKHVDDQDIETLNASEIG